MRIRDIKPKEITTENGTKEVKFLWLYDFSDYDFTNGECNVYYRLHGEELKETFRVYKEFDRGVVVVPSDVVKSVESKEEDIWGFVANQLNVEFI